MSCKKAFRWFFFCLALVVVLGAACPAAEASTKTVTVTMKKVYKTKKKSARVGDTVLLRLKRGGVILVNDNVTLRSSRPAVASVSADGEITARKTGIAVITAKYKNRMARIRLTVKPAAAVTSKTTSDQAAADQSVPEDVMLFDSEESAAAAGATSTSQSSVRSSMVSYAAGFVGVLPYVYAGNSLKTGTDCSGFIHLIYKHFGISAPRSASDFQKLSNISYSDLLPGDIIVYRNGGHVALYIGNDMIIHAKGSAYGTVKEKMWYNTPTGYVRLIKD